MRTLTAVIIGCTLVGTLMACPAPGGHEWGAVTDTDRERYQALRADPVFDGLDKWARGELDVPVGGGPGEYRDWLLVRSEVRAEFYLKDLRTLRQRGQRLLDAARDAGWTLYRAECTGSSVEEHSFPDPPINQPVRWDAWAYKHDGSVSYLLRIASTARRSDGDAYTGHLRINAYAAHSEERLDLLPERPSPVTEPCMRAGRTPADTLQGLDVVFDGSYNRNAAPDPGGPTR